MGLAQQAAQHRLLTVTGNHTAICARGRIICKAHSPLASCHQTRRCTLRRKHANSTICCTQMCAGLENIHVDSVSRLLQAFGLMSGHCARQQWLQGIHSHKHLYRRRHVKSSRQSLANDFYAVQDHTTSLTDAVISVCEFVHEWRPGPSGARSGCLQSPGTAHMHAWAPSEALQTISQCLDESNAGPQAVFAGKRYIATLVQALWLSEAPCGAPGTSQAVVHLHSHPG